MTRHRILSVGQCSMDHGSLSRFLKPLAAEVASAESADEALDHLRQGSFALVLVNRVFDATGEAGVEFIRQAKADAKLRDVAMMLVSNFPEAQAEAVAAGALPGFGKANLRDAATLDRLRALLA